LTQKHHESIPYRIVQTRFFTEAGFGFREKIRLARTIRPSTFLMTLRQVDATHSLCVHRSTKNSAKDRQESVLRRRTLEKSTTAEIWLGCRVCCYFVGFELNVDIALRNINLLTKRNRPSNPWSCLLQHYVSHWTRRVQKCTHPFNRSSSETSLPTKQFERMRVLSEKTTNALAPIRYWQKNYSSH